MVNERLKVSVSEVMVAFLGAIIGAIILASGILLNNYILSKRTKNEITIRPEFDLNAKIQSPAVSVKATLEQSERIVERIKVAPVTVMAKTPDVKVAAPNVTVRPEIKVNVPDAYGDKLPSPKGE